VRRPRQGLKPTRGTRTPDPLLTFCGAAAAYICFRSLPPACIPDQRIPRLRLLGAWRQQRFPSGFQAASSATRRRHGQHRRVRPCRVPDQWLRAAHRFADLAAVLLALLLLHRPRSDRSGRRHQRPRHPRRCIGRPYSDRCGRHPTTRYTWPTGPALGFPLIYPAPVLALASFSVCIACPCFSANQIGQVLNVVVLN
jgi:hypothetical protein